MRIHCVYVKTMRWKRHIYICHGDVVERQVVETMPWKNNFQRQDGQDDVEDLACSNTK